MSQVGLCKSWPACYLKWAYLRLAFSLSHMGLKKGCACLLSKRGGGGGVAVQKTKPYPTFPILGLGFLLLVFLGYF